MEFSSLCTEFCGSKNPLYLLREKLESAGHSVRDLIQSSVNQQGIIYPPDLMAEILREASKRSPVYNPVSMGQEAARQTVASLYPEWNPTCQRILLTPGSSFSYFYAFKLLADPGQEILCPRPSYPLLEYIAGLACLELKYYRLDESKNWSIDFDDLEAALSPRTKALVLISPHNPTGMVLSVKEIARLAEIARLNDLALISDEVFSDFLFAYESLPRFDRTDAPLVLTLNGISKGYALPGMKLGWLIASGDEEAVNRALDALDTMSDTFLPVNEIAQAALPEIIACGAGFQNEYKRKVKRCRDLALEALRGACFVEPAGGFYLSISIESDEVETATAILAEEKILVHPGYFYDMEGNHLVICFVQNEDLLLDSLLRIKRFL